MANAWFCSWGEPVFGYRNQLAVKLRNLTTREAWR